jgi:hypothetical protein
MISEGIQAYKGILKNMWTPAPRDSRTLMGSGIISNLSFNPSYVLHSLNLNTQLFLERYKRD